MDKKDLQKARDELNMTQMELAEALDIRSNTITRYEMGLLKIPRKIELAVNCLLMIRRKAVGDMRPTRVEIEARRRAK